jgi:hypothetical protein
MMHKYEHIGTLPIGEPPIVPGEIFKADPTNPQIQFWLQIGAIRLESEGTASVPEPTGSKHAHPAKADKE